MTDSILTAIRYPMMCVDQEIIQLQFDKYYKEFEGIEVIHLLDHKGIIRRSTDRSLIGEKSKAKGLKEALDGKEYTGIELQERTKSWVYSHLHPIRNEQSCYACHDSEQKVLGVLRLSVDWQPVDKALAVSRNHNILLSLFSLVLISLLIFISLRNIIIRPIQKLHLGTEIIGAGNLNYKVGTDAKDEIGQLSRAFDRMTEELHKTLVSRDELAGEVAERKRIEEQRRILMKDLVESNKELDDFTYIVSHDLKEPLRSIDAFSKFIEDDYKDKIADEGRDYIKRIRVNASRMEALIEDLLELSRIERKRNPLEDVETKDLIDEVKLRLEYRIKEKNAQIISQDNLPKVFCDRIRFTEVFVNLISNAIKFNDKPQPHIEIGCSEKGAFYEFCVKDNGPGIEEQYFDKIFEIFQRLGKREENEGTGAGLTIVKKIVQMHKGKIWLESKIGEGTTFYFTIPKEKGGILGKKKIGEILVERKLITEEDVKRALEEQRG